MQKATKSKKLPRAEVLKRLEEEWQRVLEETGLNPAPDALKKFTARTGLDPEIYVAGGLKITIGTLLQNFGKTFRSIAKIETEDQLERAIIQLRELRNEVPTVLRKGMKQVAAVLPRRGGPGRQPKLKPYEARQVCDQIAGLIRQKYNLKQSLQKVSELTPQLLGKKVSPRTLQKAWDKRGQEGS